MKTATVNGVKIEYEVAGEGEPILMIHGACVAETFKPLMAEPSLAKLKKIRVHRRGYAASIRVPALSVVGADSHEIFRESHRVYLETLDDVEALEVPATEHFLLVEDPKTVAEGIARFVAEHPIR